MNDKLAEFLNKALNNRGWSQRELARRADLSITTVSDVIQGKRKPSYRFCIVIARVLNEPPDDILKLAGLPSVFSKEDELPQTEMIKEIYQAAKQGTLFQLAESGRVEYLREIEGNPSFRELLDLVRQLSPEELEGLLQVAHLLVDHKQKKDYNDQDNQAIETT